MAIGQDRGGAPPTITLGAADAAKIAAVLPNVCYDGSIANCSFTAKSEVKGFSPVRTVGTPVSNTTSTPTTYSISIADQVSQSDTVGGLSVKLSGGGLAKLASIINIEITANYSHTWVQTHTFTQTVNVPVAPGKTAWIEGSVPVWNVTGDFTIKLGNSTYQSTARRSRRRIRTSPVATSSGTSRSRPRWISREGAGPATRPRTGGRYPRSRSWWRGGAAWQTTTCR